MNHLLSYNERKILDDILSPLYESQVFENIKRFDEFDVIDEGFISRLMGNEVELKSGDEIEIKSDKSTFKGVFKYINNVGTFVDSDNNRYVLDERSKDKVSILSLDMKGGGRGSIEGFKFYPIVDKKLPFIFVDEKITGIKVNGKKVKKIISNQFDTKKKKVNKITKANELDNILSDIMGRYDDDPTKKELVKILNEIEDEKSEEGENWSNKERERVKLFLKGIKKDKTQTPDKISDDVFTKVLDKVKQYSTKGVITTAMLSALVLAPGLSQAQKNQIQEFGGEEVSNDISSEKTKDNKKTIDFQSSWKKFKSSAEKKLKKVKDNISGKETDSNTETDSENSDETIVVNNKEYKSSDFSTEQLNLIKTTLKNGNKVGIGKSTDRGISEKKAISNLKSNIVNKTGSSITKVSTNKHKSSVSKIGSSYISVVVTT